MGFLESEAILVAPGGLEVIRIVGGLRGVEADNALDGVLFAVGLDQHGIGREVDSIGFEDGMIGHFARRFQVLVQQRRRHGQGFAGVIEAGLVGGIDGKLLGDVHVLAGEVADGVVVLGVAQAAGQDDSWVAGGLLYFFRADGGYPVDDLLRFGGGRGRHRLGRHFLGSLVSPPAGPNGRSRRSPCPRWCRTSGRIAPGPFCRYGKPRSICRQRV